MRPFSGLLLALMACRPDPVTPAPQDESAEACGAWTYTDSTDLVALPSDAPAGAFVLTRREEADCDAGLPAVATVDLTGDGVVDLVALTDCDDSSVGDTRWDVWPGTGDGFDGVVSWSVPDGYGAGAFDTLIRTAADCTGEANLPAFRLADLTGDGLQDLLVSESCVETTLGGSAWRVYPNTGSGFGEGSDWSLPTEDYGPGAFVTPRDETNCAGTFDAPAWALTDLTGDGADDLVITDTCRDTEGVESWQVYASDGASLTWAVDWPVDPSLTATTLERTESQCFSGFPSYFLLDVDADGRRDLVVQQDCTWQDGAVDILRNNGTGFLEATPFDMPWSVDPRIVRQEQEAAACSLGVPAWVFDGSVPALTITESCSDPAIGDTRWTAYAGTSGGWSAATPVWLPRGYSPGSFDGSGSDDLACTGTANHPAWRRMDLDGDNVAELVVTAACDDGDVGVSSWRVYRRTCAGVE